jgi:hypothetical protein
LYRLKAVVALSAEVAHVPQRYALAISARDTLAASPKQETGYTRYATIRITMIIKTAVALLIMVVLTAAQTLPSSAKPSAATSEINPATKAFTKAFAKAVAAALGNYREWWSVLSEEEKDSFIDGYRDAMRHANSVTDGFCQQNKKAPQPGHAFDEQVKGVMTLCIVSEEFDFKVAAPFKPHLDEFYRDPLNARIPPFLAMRYVRDDITGKKTAGQLLDELNDWRKRMDGDSSNPSK